MRFFLLIFFFMSLLNAGEKVALLIGNTDYKFKPLSNPVNDVRAIKKTLIEIGFKKENVMVLENASRREIIDALLLFRKKVKKVEIAFLYFSGHGIQVDNQNYLFPANSTAKNYLDLENLIKLNSFINSTTPAKYEVILIDACRTNPLTKYFEETKSKGGTETQKRGLGQVKASQSEQVIIGFATQAGSVASDGKQNNSPYAKALIKNLKLNLEIRPILGQVRREVSKATKGTQNPIYDDSIGLDGVCLTGVCTGESSNINRTRVQEEFVEPEQENIGTIDRLMYQREPSLGRFTWKEAKRYCEKLTLKGYSNWRLPSKKELSKILKRESIKQKEIHLWTQYKGKDSLVWAVNVDEYDWYRSETPNEWKSPSLCVRKINKKGKR